MPDSSPISRAYGIITSDCSSGIPVADPKLLEAADLMIEMTSVEHRMDVGQKGQPGIEW